MNGNLSILGLLLKTDPIVKLIISSLILFSITTLAIFFDKILFYRSVMRKIRSFERKFWSGVMLEEFYESNKGRLKHPIGSIFIGGMQEWFISETNNSINSVELFKAGLRSRIENATEISMIESEKLINKSLSIVSTIASISPFVGLLGTVWGIMRSFLAIAGTSNVSIVAVAPGIAEALITTAMGIFVAIISVFLYNYLRLKAQNILSKLESFRFDFVNILSRELDGFSIRNYRAFQEKNKNLS